MGRAVVIILCLYIVALWLVFSKTQGRAMGLSDRNDIDFIGA
jgi:hypothetical protein